MITCPTCQTRIDLSERCPVRTGTGRCMELTGHAGFHWTDFGRDGGVTIWFGPYRAHSCAGRLSLVDWCKKPPGHEGAHNNGHGVTFGDPIDEEDI